MGEAAKGSDVRLELRRTFEAPRERVFRAWTERQALLEWYAPAEATVALCEVDVRPGGRWRVHMRSPEGEEYRVSGEYRAVEPPDRIAFTWRWDTDPEDQETLVTVEFHERDGRTDVVLTHEGLPSDESRAKHEQGWSALLAKLTDVVAG